MITQYLAGWSATNFYLVVAPHSAPLNRRAVAARCGQWASDSATGTAPGIVTADQLEMISTDTWVMHGQAVIAGTHVPVSAILDCLAPA